jgi:hypothetical protein
MLETTFVCSANKFSALDKKIASLHLCYSHNFLAFGSSLYEENRECKIITQARLRQASKPQVILKTPICLDYRAHNRSQLYMKSYA